MGLDVVVIHQFAPVGLFDAAPDGSTKVHVLFDELQGGIMHKLFCSGVKCTSMALRVEITVTSVNNGVARSTSATPQLLHRRRPRPQPHVDARLQRPPPHGLGRLQFLRWGVGSPFSLSLLQCQEMYIRGRMRGSAGFAPDGHRGFLDCRATLRSRETTIFGKSLLHVLGRSA